MRKFVTLPIRRRKSFRSVEEEFGRADIIDEILRAADDGCNFEIETDLDTAQYINDYFGCEIAHARGGVSSGRK